MLAIFHLSQIPIFSKTLISPQNPQFPKHFSQFHVQHFPKHFHCFCFQNHPMSSSSSSSSSKIVAEYAKSNRSSCKKCDTKISAKSLRLGLVSKDPRGYDATKWHHLDCFFASGSDSVSSVAEIKGFDSLEANDQEELKKLIDKCVNSLDEVLDRAKDVDKVKKETNNKVSKTEDDKSEEKQRSSKKTKLFAPAEETELPIAISVADIKDKYKDATLSPNWKAIETVIFLERDDGLHDSSKIAAFDFDGCLANTDVRRVGPDAWSLMYLSIPHKLQSLYNDGYKLVIFTNESNIERWKNKRQIAVDSKIGRLNNFLKVVKVPIQIYIACGVGTRSDGKPEDRFRKPKTGMWRIMEQNFNSGIAIDMNQSFYVGDAAGRPNDHSDADIKFAQAIGLEFHVPEDYFAT